MFILAYIYNAHAPCIIACSLYSSLFTKNGRNLRIIQLYQNKQHA